MADLGRDIGAFGVWVLKAREPIISPAIIVIKDTNEFRD